MKKLLTIVCVMLLLFSVVSCSQKNSVVGTWRVVKTMEEAVGYLDKGLIFTTKFTSDGKIIQEFSTEKDTEKVVKDYAETMNLIQEGNDFRYEIIEDGKLKWLNKPGEGRIFEYKIEGNQLKMSIGEKLWEEDYTVILERMP